MKVTKGKLQVGDVVHFKSGAKVTVADFDLVGGIFEYDTNIPSLLEEPTAIVKIARKNPWKKTGRLIDEMINAHLMPDISTGMEGQKTIVKLYFDYGERQSFEDGDIHSAVKKAYDTAKRNGLL
jgi:hypothetical protein